MALNNDANSGTIVMFLDQIAQSFTKCDVFTSKMDSRELFWNVVTVKNVMNIGAEYALKMNDYVRAKTYNISAGNALMLLQNVFFNSSPLTDESYDITIMKLNYLYENSLLTDSIFTIETAKYVISHKNFYHEISAKVSDKSYVLSTAAVAGLLYRIADQVLHDGNSVDDPHLLYAWQVAIDSPLDLPSNSKELAVVLANQGDSLVSELNIVLSSYFDSEYHFSVEFAFQLFSELLTAAYYQ